MTAGSSRRAARRPTRTRAASGRFHWLDSRPVIVTVAGPNGAGKTTFHEAHLKRAGLRFVNADVAAGELALNGYEAARLAAEIRETLLAERESFVFETVFSDPVGDKISFLQRAVRAGYAVVLCFIGISGPDVSETRVAMRVSQGGHDVPHAKLVSRYPRTMANLRQAVGDLPHVLVFDNDDLGRPFRLVAEFENGKARRASAALPRWFHLDDQA
jgi:predicted ABC-type ATPase